MKRLNREDFEKQLNENKQEEPSASLLSEAALIQQKALVETGEMKKEKIEFNETAFTIAKDGNTLAVLRIKFDLKTKTIGDIQLVEKTDSRQLANETFKMEVAKSGLLG